MKSINLVPGALLIKRLWLSRLELAGITVLIIGVASGGLWLLIQQQATYAESQADAAKNSTLVAVKQALSSADTADTVLRVATLNAFAASEVNWPKALSDVGALVPSDVKLSTFSYAIAASKLTLQMGGQAKTASVFAAFATTLQGDARFSSVHVDSYTYTPTTGSVTFALTGVRGATQLMYTLPK